MVFQRKNTSVLSSKKIVPPQTIKGINQTQIGISLFLVNFVKNYIRQLAIRRRIGFL